MPELPQSHDIVLAQAFCGNTNFEDPVSNDTITFILDGKEVEARDSETIWQIPATALCRLVRLTNSNR